MSADVRTAPSPGVLLAAPALPMGLCWRASALPTAWLAQPLAEQRERQHQAGRGLAAEALHAAGATVLVVPRLAHGAPQWPTGWVGSLAHSAHHAVAVVAVQSRFIALGVDVEPDAPLPADAAATLLSPAEYDALQGQWPHSGLREARRVLGAKECIHKALHPLNGSWLEFDEVCVRPLSATQWQAEPLSDAARAGFGAARLEGQWWRADGALWALLALSP